MKSKEQLICTNCKDPLRGKRHVFQGVIICDNCFKLVSHAIQRTQKELKMLFLVYTDMIRVGLLKGEFRPPVMPPAGKKLPHSELAKAMQEMAKKGLGDEGASQDTVHPLRRDQVNADGKVFSG